MNPSYLPSKLFVKKVAIFAGLILIAILITKATPTLRTKIKVMKDSKILVKDAIENDSNSNGIQDWEEKLWGLDPSADGASNKTFINAKKKILEEKTESNTEITQNDKLSREFFSLVMSLEDSGLSTEDALAKLSREIVEKVTLVPIPNTYKIGNVATVPPTKNSISLYKDALTNIIKKYEDKGVGSEMNLLAVALDHEDKNLLGGIKAIQSSYFDMIGEISKIKIPNDIVTTHISFLNNLEGSAIALTQVSKVFDDQISGLSGIATYRTDNDAATKALTSITKYIEDAIIKQ